MEDIGGRLEFVDSLKPDIAHYLGETEPPDKANDSAPKARALDLGDWLTSQRVLCYSRPCDEAELWQSAREAPCSGPRGFGAPPAPGSLQWPARPSGGPLVSPTASASDSGSESGSASRSGLSPEEELLEFTSCFESGNLRCALYDKEGDEYLLFLDNDVHSKGHTQWFYFAVRNAKPRRYCLRIVNMSKPKALFRLGMRPVAWSELAAQSTQSFEESLWAGEAAGLWQPAGEDVRYCRTSWSCPDSNNYTLSFDYVFEEHDTVFFAYYVPYTYSMLQRTLSLCRGPSTRAFCRAKRLATTVGEARCEMLTITNPLISRKMKKAVIVSSRVHPGESNASWLVHGLIGFLLSATAEAQVLRDHFVWMIVPMLNPDGVVCGNYRCGLCGMDLNRQWRQPNAALHGSVYKLKKLVARSKAKLCLYLDLHGHSRKCGIFSYACGQFSEDDHRRFTVRIYPKLLSLLIPEFNLLNCRWTVGKGKRGTGRVVVAKDLGITNAFTIEASMWGAVDASQAASAEGEEFGQAVSCFGPSKLQLMGAQLGRALLLQHSLQPMVAARLRSSPAWDSDRGGPWPTLFPEKDLDASIPRASSVSSASSEESDGSGCGEPLEAFTPPAFKEEEPPSTQGNVNFLDINMADIMRDIKQHTNFSVVEDSDSGGSDSAPSGDNLGEKELRQVEDNLVCRRPMRAKRKPSRTKTGTKRLSKVPSKREVAPAVRHRARTKSATKPMAPAEVKETKEAPELPRRDLLQRVVAFGQTTYLATSPSSPTGFTSPLRRFQERPERRELLRNAGSCMLRGEESQSCTSLAAPRAASLAREARERRPMTATSREKSGALRSHSDGRRSSDQLRQAPVKWISWDEDLPLGELSLSPSRTLRPRVRKAEMGLLLPWAALALEEGPARSRR